MSKKETKPVHVEVPVDEPQETKAWAIVEKEVEKKATRPRDWSVQKETFLRQKFTKEYSFYNRYFPYKKFLRIKVKDFYSIEWYLEVRFQIFQRTQEFHKENARKTQGINKQTAIDFASYMRTFLSDSETFQDILNKQESIVLLNLLIEKEYYKIVGYDSFNDMINDLIIADRTFPSPIMREINKVLNVDTDKRDQYKKVLEAYHFVTNSPEYKWRKCKEKAMSILQTIILKLFFKKRKANV